MWVFLTAGIAVGWIRWRSKRERSIAHYARLQRNQQRWPHCAVRVAEAGLWIQQGVTVWTIPWAQVSEALSGPSWWGLHLQSGEFVGLYWEGAAPSLTEWWP